MIHELNIDYSQLSGIIDSELSRKWWNSWGSFSSR